MRVLTLALLALSLAGCAGQSLRVNDPIWISSDINGLQASTCPTCGGMLPKSAAKKLEREQEKKPVSERKPLSN